MCLHPILGPNRLADTQQRMLLSLLSTIITNVGKCVTEYHFLLQLPK